MNVVEIFVTTLVLLEDAVEIDEDRGSGATEVRPSTEASEDFERKMTTWRVFFTEVEIEGREGIVNSGRENAFRIRLFARDNVAIGDKFVDCVNDFSWYLVE